MIDLTTETAITFRGATKLPELQRNGRRLHVSTVFRWYQRGIRGIKLEAQKQGGSLVTSREAIARFFATLSGEIPADEQIEHRTPVRRHREHQRAEAELVGAGW